jgi:hypothetical protein
MGDVVTRSPVFLRSTNFTRPNDTTPYAIGDVVCNSTSAPAILQFAQPCVDRSSTLMTATITSSACQATKPYLRLWLFDTTVVMDNDNATFTPTDTEIATLQQVIAFPDTSWLGGDLTVGAGGNAMCNAQNLWLPIQTALSAAGVADNTLYGVLVAGNAYTPVANEVFTIKLGFVL